MKVYTLMAAIILGAALPIATLIASPANAQHQKITYNAPLEGTFGDARWTVTVSQKNGVYRYYGHNLGSSNSIELLGATVVKQGTKRLYIWNNNGTKYRLTWQPQDQGYVRVQVIDANRTEVLNRLLSRHEDGC